VLTSPLTIPISPADMPFGLIRCSKINSVCVTRLRLKQSSTNYCLFYPRLIMSEGVLVQDTNLVCFPDLSKRHLPSRRMSDASYKWIKRGLFERVARTRQGEWRSKRGWPRPGRSAIFNQSRMYPKGPKSRYAYLWFFLVRARKNINGLEVMNLRLTRV